MASIGIFVSDEDIFEVTDQIRSKKKQLDIKGIFNYLTKTEKFGNVLLDYLSKRHHELSGAREKKMSQNVEWYIFFMVQKVM